MADQERSGLYVVLTTILCGGNLCLVSCEPDIHGLAFYAFTLPPHVILSPYHFRQQSYAGISLTGYHPPGLSPGPLIFSVKIPVPGTTFQYKTPAPGSKKGNKIPTLGHNLPGSNDKISMKKEHNFIRAASFQIFHNCQFDNFLLSWE